MLDYFLIHMYSYILITGYKRVNLMIHKTQTHKRQYTCGMYVPKSKQSKL